jgi:hypothetical protein
MESDRRLVQGKGPADRIDGAFSKALRLNVGRTLPDGLDRLLAQLVHNQHRRDYAARLLLGPGGVGVAFHGRPSTCAASPAQGPYRHRNALSQESSHGLYYRSLRF